MSKQHEFIYDYRDDHNENNKKLARNAIILLVISILLFLFTFCAN